MRRLAAFFALVVLGFFAGAAFGGCGEGLALAPLDGGADLAPVSATCHLELAQPFASSIEAPPATCNVTRAPGALSIAFKWVVGDVAYLLSVDTSPAAVRWENPHPCAAPSVTATGDSITFDALCGGDVEVRGVLVVN